MPSAGPKKQAQMRVYMKTPAGIASKKRSQEKWLDKRREGHVIDTLKINPTPLLKALANWR